MVYLSIILVNFNTCDLTCQAIRSVLKFTQKYSFEIIVVDNASKDNSVNEIARNFPDVKILKNKRNIGFGRANNEGLKIAKGQFVLFLNTDTYLEEPAIDGLLEEMEKEEYKNVAVAGAKLTKPDDSHNISSGLFPSFPNFIQGSFLKSVIKTSEDSYPGLLPTHNYPYEVDYVSGADFMVRKFLLDEVGGFDARFFMYSEEVELTHRIYQKFPDMVSMIFPQYKIIHISQGSSSSKKDKRKIKLRQIKSRALYYSITRNKLSGMLYYLIRLKRLYINKI